MLLLAGLGNPGPRYAWNRHNVGYMALDEIVQRHAFDSFRKRFDGLIAGGEIGGSRVLALKPTTFMNRSGRSVAGAARFYKIPIERIIVIHDEIDLAPGKFRVKSGGGNAGHRGLESLDAHLGKGYQRLRIGVGHPGAKHLVQSYVLRDFAKEDEDWLNKLLPAIGKAVPLLIAGDAPGFMNKVHVLINPRPPKPKPERPDNSSEGGADDGH